MYDGLFPYINVRVVMIFLYKERKAERYKNRQEKHFDFARGKVIRFTKITLHILDYINLTAFKILSGIVYLYIYIYKANLKSLWTSQYQIYYYLSR